MYRKPILIVILVVALVTMACGVHISLPVKDVKTGPIQTDEINIPSPGQDETVAIDLEFGAGELRLGPGAEDALVQGTATYNVMDLKPVIERNGNNVRIQTGELNLKGIPRFNEKLKNEWDLKLGNSPINLGIKAGAYKGRYEFGGLALQSLDISDGASEVVLKFSEPNLTEMNTLRYETGASNVKLSGLANANFNRMNFRSGAGDYTLDFSGNLKRDADVSVDSGISKVVIIVPKGVSAKVIFQGGLSNIDVYGTWQKTGGQYVMDGNGPTLTFNVNMGAGSLELRND